MVSTDHMIEGGDYKGAIAKGREYIPQGKIVCLGIPAWRFEPGYGYFRQVEERTEFRHSDMTEEIPAGEKWYYDTGILLFNGGDFLHELSRKSPALYAQIRECVDQLDTYERNVLVPGRLVEELEPVSIGRAVTSVSDKVLLLQADFKWRRIMTLESLDQYYHGEDSGRVIRNACENVSVMNEAAHQLVVANGLEDVIIVNTADAVYVSRKSEADQIKSGSVLFLREQGNTGETTFLREEKRYGLLLKSKNPDYPDLKMEGTSFLIGKRKESVDGWVPAPTVSRIHARIIKEEGCYLLEDLNSTNGTRAGQHQLNPYELFPLDNGMRVAFAGAEYEAYL